jgi:hypothetical protein
VLPASGQPHRRLPKCWKSAPIMHATLSANTLP